MNNPQWLFFSFTLSAKSQAARMRLWRRLTSLGAVIVKSAFYALPATPELREQLTWLVKEAESLGGEALFFESGPPATMDDQALAGLFTQARDADWQALEEEASAVLERARSSCAANTPPDGGPRGVPPARRCEPKTGGPAQAKDAVPAELEPLRRKLLRRSDALRERDYFPSGRPQRVADIIEELTSLLAGRVPQESRGIPQRDPKEFQNMVWVTRQAPYIDRLASFWLVLRFIDPLARIAFLPAGEAAAPEEGKVRFDMDQAEFTHVGGLTTFEVLCACFALHKRIPARMRRVIRAIDVSGVRSGPDEALGVKRLLDGICRSAPDDEARVTRSMELFDALLASYETQEEQMRP